MAQDGTRIHARPSARGDLELFIDRASPILKPGGGTMGRSRDEALRSTQPMKDVTQIFQEIDRGSPDAADRLAR
jgi:hypothetical protein